jgi:hypothetical protein
MISRAFAKSAVPIGRIACKKLDLRVHSTKVNSVFTLRAARPTKYRSTHLVMIATNQHRNYATAGPRPKRTRRDSRGLR